MNNRVLLYGVAFSSFRMLVGAISAAYMLKHGVMLSDIGLIKTFQAGIILILDIPLAYIADRYSRKLSVVASIFAAAIWLYLMSIADSILDFYIAEIFNSLSIALSSGAFTAYLINTSQIAGSAGNIKNILSRYGKYRFFGMGVFAFLGSAFIVVDSREIWIVASILMFGLLPLAYFLPEDREAEKEKIKKTVTDDIKEIIQFIKKNRGYLYPVATSLVVVQIFYQVIIQYWQPFSFLDVTLIPEAGIWLGVIFSLILLFQSLASYFSEKLQDIEKVILFGNIFNFLGLTLIIFSVFFSINALYFATIAIFFGLRLSTLGFSSYFHEIIPSDMRSTFDSFVSSVLRFSLIIFLPIVSILLELYGWTTWTILIALLILVPNIVKSMHTISSLQKSKK